MPSSADFLPQGPAPALPHLPAWSGTQGLLTQPCQRHRSHEPQEDAPRLQSSRLPPYLRPSWPRAAPAVPPAGPVAGSPHHVARHLELLAEMPHSRVGRMSTQERLSMPRATGPAGEDVGPG